MLYAVRLRCYYCNGAYLCSQWYHRLTYAGFWLWLFQTAFWQLVTRCFAVLQLMTKLFGIVQNKFCFIFYKITRVIMKCENFFLLLSFSLYLAFFLFSLDVLLSTWNCVSTLYGYWKNFLQFIMILKVFLLEISPHFIYNWIYILTVFANCNLKCLRWWKCSCF